MKRARRTRLASVPAGLLLGCVAFGVAMAAVSASHTISRVAGTGVLGFAGDDGPALSADLGEPLGVARDAAGNIYIGDRFNHRVRRVGTDGKIAAFAGNSLNVHGGDGGPALSAGIGGPAGVAFDSLGNLYVASQFHKRVRMVTPAGLVSTYAGTGGIGYSGDNGLATAAQIGEPVGLAVDSSRNLYIASWTTNVVRKVSATTGIITTVAGTGTGGFSGDGGGATSAQLSAPMDVAVDAAGVVYIADQLNHRIRKVALNGVITTIAGTGSPGSAGDGGPATVGQLNTPSGVAVDPDGTIYIADTFNRRIRAIAPDGVISTVAGTGVVGNTGDGGAAGSAQLSDLWDVIVEPDGSVLFTQLGASPAVRRIQKPAPPSPPAPPPPAPPPPAAPAPPPPAKPLPRLNARVRFRVQLGRDVQVLSLRVVGMPRGSRVSIACSRGCKLSKVTVSSGAAVNLSALFRGRRLPPGVTIIIRVTKRGSVGRYFRYRITSANVRGTECSISAKTGKPTGCSST